MGGAMSNAANSVGSVIGNALAAPFKSVFGRSCEDVCSGTWDVICFIEHFCIPDLVKLLLVFSLCYMTSVFIYLLFKVGICRCLAKSLCKMSWAACETCWFVLADVTCFCWHKIRYTKRVYRGHRRRCQFKDVELGCTSSNGTAFSDHHGSYFPRKRKSSRVTMNQLQNSFCPSRRGNRSSRRRRHSARQNTFPVSARLKHGSLGARNSSYLQIRRLNKCPRKTTKFKKQRLR
ncbi:hypothetical protein Ancab_029224 [Ancistrocladus abbreviatus]